jgi:hypothetical protein
VTGFTAARARLASRLEGAGLAGVTLNPDAVPPAVIVGLPEDIDGAGPGGWSCTIPVWLVAPPGDVAAVDALVDLLPAALDALRPNVTGDPDPYTVSGKPCPAFRLAVRNVTIPNPAPCTPIGAPAP